MKKHLLRRIEQNSRKFSDQAALIMDEDVLSYQQLITEANKLANGLVELEVKPGDSVGLVLDKSFEAVISILAILKVGANYVPFNHRALQTRHLVIVNSCQINVIISNSHHVKPLESLQSISSYIETLIFLDNFDSFDPMTSTANVKTGQWVHNQSDKHTAIDISQADTQVASVLFTSGSTGIPKGALITHSNIIAFVDWGIEQFSLTHNDKVISHAPFFFDLSLFDLFCSLCCGAACVLVPSEKINNAAYLLKLIARQKITVWQSAPSILKSIAMLTEESHEADNNLRHIIFAGEKLAGKYVRQLMPIFKQANFSNVYGCTETNDTFIYQISKSTDVPDELPIGLPLPYVDYYLLNKQGEKAMEGELYVSCPTTMLEYINLDLKKPVFYFDDQGQRFYRTGDRAKKYNNGLLYLLERTDDIIKTNGYRVSLMEIETCLNHHSDIAQACVIAIDDEAINKKIIAFIQLVASSTLKRIHIRQYCSEYIPSYAIPKIFHMNNGDFELTASGKIDKNKLLEKIMME